MFLFVENLAGLDIASNSPDLSRRRLLKFATPSVMAFSDPRFFECGWVFTLTPTKLRLLKALLSLLQLPVIQQDPFSWAFRLNLWKHVLSDGLLTEFIIKRLGVRVRHFYSLSSSCCNTAVVLPGCAIVGSNWLEFGSMSVAAYKSHLDFLAQRYPDALYYCHPKECSKLPEQSFGVARVRRPDKPLENLLRTQGIPEKIIGVCSSSLLALASMNPASIKVELIFLDATVFDGKQADIVYQLRRAIGGRDSVRVADLQEFLLAELAALGVIVSQTECRHKP